jgi:hypothetical protein
MTSRSPPPRSPRARAPALRGSQEEPPAGAEPDDRDDRVLAIAPEAVAVKRDAVPPVPVRGEGDVRKRPAVVPRERGAERVHERMPGAVVGQHGPEAGDVDDPLVHAAAMRLPVRGRPQRLEQRLVTSHPPWPLIDPRAFAQVDALEPAQICIEAGLAGAEQIALVNDTILPRAHH